MIVGLIVLGMTGQLDADDPAIFGIENPLLFLPATWFAGWIIASIQLARSKRQRRAATAKADQRASERARIRADFDRRIAAINKQKIL